MKTVLAFSEENNFLSLFRNVRIDRNFPLIPQSFFCESLFTLSADSLVFFTTKEIEVSSANNFVVDKRSLIRFFI